MSNSIKDGKDYCENWCEHKYGCCFKPRHGLYELDNCKIIDFIDSLILSQGFTIAKFPTPFGREGRE